MDWGLLTLALMLAVFVWVYVARLRRDEEHRLAEREALRHRVAQDPSNVGAQEALGDSLRAAGRWTEARDAYLGALTAAGGGPLGERIQYRLHQLNLDIRRRAAESSGHAAPSHDIFFCRQCGAANAPTARVCEICGVTLPHETFGGALRDKDLLRASLEAGACLLVLFAALAVAAAQPIEVKGCLIIATVMVMGWRFLQAIGSPKV